MLEILEHFYFIERGFLNANHFVYAGAKPALIDTGYSSSVEETARLIAQTGVQLKKVDLIINTHSHCDHIGGNRFIQNLSGCNIAMHAIGKHWVDTHDDWATWWRYYHQEAAFFTCTHELRHDDTLNLGPHTFQVIYTPGHASDGIILYHPEERILISSDTLWERDMAVVTERVEGSRALFEIEASLDKIAALDVALIYPGHGKPFKDKQAAIDRARERIQRFKNDKYMLGNDLLKKIIVYTLLMQKTIRESHFF